MNDPRGSIWRKWDLHIHSNASDGKMTPVQIIAKAKEINLDVIALTDHHTAKNINEIILIGDREGISVIPGIEFRTEYGHKSVHIIGLFPREFNGIDINTKSLNELILNPLDLSETKIITVGKEKLISEGKTNPSEEESFKRGIFEVQVDFKSAAKLIHEKLGGLIVVHAGTKENSLEQEMKHNGKPGVTPYDSLGPVKEELFKKGFIDICEIRNDRDNREFYLKKFSKPSIVTSDAHEIEDIGSKFTWIKADPTFEGLKQILYEPEIRIKIQDMNPELDFQKIRIKNFKIKNSENYIIKNQDIEFNRDLTCIIGGRGSGKTALVESIAYCFDQHEKKENKPYFNANESFIEFYKNKEDVLVDFELIYCDKDNIELELFTKKLTTEDQDDCAYPILYLGQNKIESIASSEEKLHNLSFETVIKNSTNYDTIEQLNVSIEKQKEDLIILNNKVIGLRSTLNSFEIKSIQNEIEKSIKELKLLESDKTKEALDKLTLEREKRDKYSKFLKLIEEIEDELVSFERGTLSKLSLLHSLLEQEGIKEFNLKVDVKTVIGQLDSIRQIIGKQKIEEHYQNFLAEVKELLQGKIDVSIEYIDGVRSKIIELQSRKSEYDEIEKKYKQKTDERYDFLKQIHDSYVKYLNEYKLAVEVFTKANSDILSGIRLTPYHSINPEAIFKTFYKIADGRKIKSPEKLNTILSLPEKPEDFADWAKTIHEEQEFADYFNISSNEEIEKRIFNVFHSIGTKIEYKLGNNYKTIDKLSLGQKGTVILKLYLLIGGNCPIIIDQPEDHLDNDFIYSDLVKTFRKAKEKRQIIIVTHDANLVVNGDADQIIIAHFENEEIGYNVRGAIENKEIRKKTAKILEGGDQAFLSRESKYQFVKN